MATARTATKDASLETLSLAAAAEASGFAVSKVMVERGTLIGREGEHKDIALLASGFAVATKRTKTGGQQNVAIFVTGDVIGHESFALGSYLADVTALTLVQCVTIGHAQLGRLLDTDPAFARAFWRQVTLQGAVAHEWLLNIGQRPALSCLSHLFCELVCRLHLAGQGDLDGCTIPLTQSGLADTLGLSAVHVNRTLQQMRQEGLIALHRDRLTILNWQRLAEVAQFESTYLKPAS